MIPSHLFTPLKLGRYTLDHRIIMPPLTRMRADENNAPTDLTVEYYSQRASKGGLIIAEATQASQDGQGYPSTPGIYSDIQVAAWKKVTDAVHAKGGIIFLQIWHTGRVSHSSYQNGNPPLAPSAIAITGQKATTITGESADYEVPRALTLEEIKTIIASFHHAAKNAMKAGFDGVEIHGANGYLIEQFLHDSTNRRQDIYGGSVENRSRFLFEITKTVIEAVGHDRVGVRLSPFGTFNDVGDSDPLRHYGYILKELQKYNLAYLHMVEARNENTLEVDPSRAIELLRPFWPENLILAGGFNAEIADKTIKENEADAIAFGRYFIANPDLPKRYKQGAALNPYHRESFYGGSEKGYTDYPFLEK